MHSKPTITDKAFTYAAGCVFECHDVGRDGVIVTMTDPQANEPVSVLLPRGPCVQLAQWLLGTRQVRIVDIPDGAGAAINRVVNKQPAVRGDTGRLKATAAAIVQMKRIRSIDLSGRGDNDCALSETP